MASDVRYSLNGEDITRFVADCSIDPTSYSLTVNLSLVESKDAPDLMTMCSKRDPVVLGVHHKDCPVVIKASIARVSARSVPGGSFVKARFERVV